MGAKKRTVSIIIPAYNVEEYVERCVESLLAQTYRDIEIVIVDDGSTDGTGAVCRRLCKKDSRIVYVYKKNGGQGAARNLGIRISTGSYITFADSDDWCAPEYVEEMYRSMERFDADICVCGKYGVDLDENGNIVKKRVIEQWMLPEQRLLIAEHRDLIYQIKYSLWSKMFRRELFIENQIWQPDHKFENNTVIPMLVAQAKALSMIDKPLYFYWMNRGSSTINTGVSYADMVKCLQDVETYFKREGLWRGYRSSLRRFAEWNVNHTLNRLNQIRAKMDEAMYEKITTELKQYAATTYPEIGCWSDKKICIWGSYNLRKTVMDIVPASQIANMYGFSSIVSVMESGIGELARKQHPNPYREKMIRQDCEKEFAVREQVLKKSDWLFVDLLEERYHIFRAQNVCYTWSEALEEVVDGGQTAPVERDDAYWEVWKASCLKFIDMLKHRIDADKIVLVKYKLAECYGGVSNTEAYSDMEEIRRTNQWLEQCYEFFVKNFADIYVIEPEEFLFTDKNFEYGCYPYHLNCMCYEEIAKRIKRELEVESYVL